jgi:hypothetical protein
MTFPAAPQPPEQQEQTPKGGGEIKRKPTDPNEHPLVQAEQQRIAVFTKRRPPPEGDPDMHRHHDQGEQKRRGREAANPRPDCAILGWSVIGHDWRSICTPSKVSDGCQPPATPASPLGVLAGTRSLDRLVRLTSWVPQEGTNPQASPGKQLPTRRRTRGFGQDSRMDRIHPVAPHDRNHPVNPVHPVRGKR